MATEVLWWIFAAAIVVLSAGVVFSRSIIHSAIFLIGSLAGVGAMYIFLQMEFLALVQFLIYGGAVTVLILLALMLTRPDAPGHRQSLNGTQQPFALLVGAGLMVILFAVITGTTWPGSDIESLTEVPLTLVSQRLFEDFGAPLVIASALLLVALVGAIILARQEEGE